MTSIGESAFSGCRKLTSITLPDSITRIGGEAFFYCEGLTNITIPSSVTSIGDGAFKWCLGLTNIVLPDSITSISDFLFSTCSSLTSITIPDSVTSIGAYAFSQCGSLVSIMIPSKVKSIDVYAFKECDSLVSIMIPDSVISVGLGAFYYCECLTSVAIGNSVTKIEEEAFLGCESLASIDVDLANTAYCSVDGVLFNKDKTLLHTYPIGKTNISYGIPDSVERIGTSAFALCDSLVSISIPNSVTSIGRSTFWMCTSLTSITIPDSVTDIGNSAFCYCGSLAKATVGSGVVRISTAMFSYCQDLINIVIPGSVISIGEKSFSTCSDLTSIMIPKSVTSIESGAFRTCTSLKDVYYTGSAEDWANISIGNYNTYLTSATIHYNCVDKSDGATAGKSESVDDEEPETLSLTVYQNANDSSKSTDAWRLAKGATVTNGIDSAVSDAKGKAELKNGSNDITVRKEGYLTRTLTKNRAQKAKKIYLQQDTGTRPIIQAVWMGDTDVYTAKAKVGLLEKESVTLEAEVVWKGEGEKSLYLMQKERRVAFSGGKLTTVLSDNFDVSDTIYLVAEDKNGTATKRALKFEADGALPDALDDWKLTFGDSLSAKIPSSVPVLGGSEVGLDIPFIPLTVTVEDNKVYAVLGLDVKKATDEYSFIGNVNGNSQSEFENKTKFLCENIRKKYKKSKDKYNIKKLKSKWMKAKYNYSAKFGVEADLTVIGYAEGYLDESGGLELLDAGVGINPSVKVSVGSQIIPVPPLYWEASLKGEIEGMLNLYMNQTAKNFTPNGTVEGGVELKGGVGLGASGVIGVDGGVDGTIGIKWEAYVGKQDYIALSGSIGAYVKAFAGPLTLIDKTFPFAKGIIWDHPSTRVQAMNSGFSLYNTENLALIDRSYREQESEFVANTGGIQLFALRPQNKTESVLKTNTYPYTEPQLTELADGTLLAVWLDDDSTREDINRTAVYYSCQKDGIWSDPKHVADDGTGDYAPQLTAVGDDAYLVWVNASKKLDNNTEAEAVFTCWEVAAAKFDAASGTFGTAAAITQDTQIDMMPTVFGDGTTVTVAWVKNTDGNIFGTDSTYCVMTSTLSCGVWSTPQAYVENLAPIDSLDGASMGGIRYLAYTVDLDGNQQEYTDKEVYLNKTRLTDNAVLDSKPVFDGASLYYYSNGTIVEYNISDDTTQTVAEEVPTDRFHVLSNAEQTMLVYGKSDGLVTDLYAVIRDAESKQWGKSIPLTDLASGISSFSGTLSQNGEMKFLINKKEIVGDLDDANPYGKSDLALFSVNPMYDLAIGETVYHEETLLAGNTLELYTEITNCGELTVKNYRVEVLDKDGKCLAKTYNQDPILPGETVDFTAYYPLSEEAFSAHEVTLKVVPISVDDFDMSDNTCKVMLESENIALENLSYGIDENGNAVIYSDVVNRGYTKPDSITATLHKKSADGATVGTVKIKETLDTLELATVDFTVPYEVGAVYYVTLDTPGSNSDFVVFRSDESPVVYDQATNTVMLTAEKAEEDAQMLVALYRDDVLCGVTAAIVNITAGENSFDCPVTDFGNADTIKVMFWEKNTLTPLIDTTPFALK